MLDQYFIFELLKLLPASVFWKNRAGVYLGCNNNFAKALDLKSVEEVIGKTDYDLATKDLGTHYLNDDMEVMETCIPKLNIEEEQHFPDGRKVFILTNKVPIFNQDKEVIGLLGVFNDITELKTAKLAAETASRAKTAFIANMSHDIRTPLTGIMGMADVLEKRIQTREENADIKLLYQSAEQLLALFDGILASASIEQINEDEIKKESFSLVELSQSLKDLFSLSIKLKGLSFCLDIDSSLSKRVMSDRIKLERILLNLITNAIKFTDKGDITLSIKTLALPADQDTVRIEFSVSDTGTGIPAEKIPHIFDRFFCVSKEHKGSGYGVGLYIVKKFISLLGGEIRVSSKMGEGTTFFFSLLMPLAKSEIEKKNTLSAVVFNENDQEIQKKEISMELTQQESEFTPVNVNVHKNKKLVLFVEDNQIASKIGVLLLKNAGYEVHLASNAVDALKLAKIYTFDLIMTDIGLPEINGDEFVILYRRWEQRKNKTPIFIIALTAQTSQQCEQAYLASGINEVWSKPLTEEKLKQLADYFALEDKG